MVMITYYSNFFTINKILYGDNKNSLNIEKYANEDDIINSKYYSLINRIKYKYVFKKCYKKPLGNKEYDFNF